MSKIISESSENFQAVSKNITKFFFLNSKGISENFKKYCGEFLEIFRKISKAISKNFP